MFTLVDIFGVALLAVVVGFLSFGISWVLEGHQEMMEMDFDEMETQF